MCITFLRPRCFAIRGQRSWKWMRFCNSVSFQEVLENQSRPTYWPLARGTLIKIDLKTWQPPLIFHHSLSISLLRESWNQHPSWSPPYSWWRASNRKPSDVQGAIRERYGNAKMTIMANGIGLVSVLKLASTAPFESMKSVPRTLLLPKGGYCEVLYLYILNLASTNDLTNFSTKMECVLSKISKSKFWILRQGRPPRPYKYLCILILFFEKLEKTNLTYFF